MTQYNIIVDVLGGYSRDVRRALKELVGDKSDLLKRRHRGINQLNHSRYMRERLHRHTGTSQSTESTKIIAPTELMRG